jgi:glutaredoxin
MQIEIYTIKGCSMCVHLKELLKRAKLEYKEHKVNEPNHISGIELREKYPTVMAYPFTTIVDGEDTYEFVGVIDVAKLLLKKNLVSSPKK